MNPLKWKNIFRGRILSNSANFGDLNTGQHDSITAGFPRGKQPDFIIGKFTAWTTKYPTFKIKEKKGEKKWCYSSVTWRLQLVAVKCYLHTVWNERYNVISLFKVVCIQGVCLQIALWGSVRGVAGWVLWGGEARQHGPAQPHHRHLLLHLTASGTTRYCCHS